MHRIPSQLSKSTGLALAGIRIASSFVSLVGIVSYQNTSYKLLASFERQSRSGVVSSNFAIPVEMTVVRPFVT